MATKQELEAKKQELITRRLNSVDRQVPIGDNLVNSLPPNPNTSRISLANTVIKNQSPPSAIAFAKAYILEENLQIKLINAIADTKNQIEALDSKSTTTTTSPTQPGTESTRDPFAFAPGAADSVKPRDPFAYAPGAEETVKAGIAVDKALGQDPNPPRDFDSGDGTPPTNPTLSPSTWGVKISSAASTYYMHLLPAISGNLNGTGHMDVPNVMPGLNFKFLSSYAKHKIPGWAPVYQALGIDTVLVTMIGMFTGEDGTTIPTAANAPQVRGLASPLVQATNFNKNAHTVPALNRITNTLDTYENLQSFINFGVQKQQTITIEVNIAKNGEIRPTSKTTGGIRGSNGNPTFSGIIRSLDTYYRRFDRTYYILTMEITKGIGSDCAGQPLNLTNKLDEVVKSQLAKMENSCKVGFTEGEKNRTVEEQKQLLDTLKDACYKYGEEGNVEKAFLITAAGEIQTGTFEYSTNNQVTKSTPGELYKGKEAVSFLLDNQNISNRRDCNINVGSTEDRIRTVLTASSITYKSPRPNIDTLLIEGNTFGRLGFERKEYAITKDGYFVEVSSSNNFGVKPKILSVLDPAKAIELLLDPRRKAKDVIKRFLSSPNVIYTTNRQRS